jgi:hypothetical protein
VQLVRCGDAGSPGADHNHVDVPRCGLHPIWVGRSCATPCSDVGRVPRYRIVPRTRRVTD